MKIVIISVAAFLALVPVAIASGKWLRWVSPESEEAEKDGRVSNPMSPYL
jgi:hypothetical protein